MTYLKRLTCVILLTFSFTSWVQAQGLQSLFGPNYPGSFKGLVKKVQPAVVNISTSKTVKIRSGFDDYFRMHYGMPKSRRQSSLGTGFIIDGEGFILTNNHVVGGADQIKVKLSDGRTLSAKIVGVDRKTDLAVIKVESDGNLPVASLGDSDQSEVGDWVMAVGNPFGLGHTVTAGIISAKGRVIGAGPYDDFIQTDASINPGNSGGPLFNLKGEVVGINTAIVQSGQGIGFAIPVNLAKTIIPQLIKGKRVDRGFLGVGIQDVPSELAHTFKIPAGQGALVMNIVKGGPADQAGLLSGDVILRFGDKLLQASQDLPLWVSQTPPGSKLGLEIIRRGKREKIKVKIGHLNKNLASNDATLLGIRVKKQNQGRGLRVHYVHPKSRAHTFGVRPGDVLLEMNGKKLETVNDFNKIERNLQSGQQVSLSLRRRNMQSVLSFTL